MKREGLLVPVLLFALSGTTSAQQSPGYLTFASEVGDIDGDGVVDYAVADPYNAPYLGSVAVRSGSDDSTILDLAPPPSQSFFGIAIGGAGDIDGDGVPDVAVAAILSTGEGLINIYSGWDAKRVFYVKETDLANRPLKNSCRPLEPIADSSTSASKSGVLRPHATETRGSESARWSSLAAC